MCIICLDYQKKKLTLQEAYNNLGEMKASLDEEHFEEVYEMLNEDFFNEVLADDETNANAQTVNDTLQAYMNASASCDDLISCYDEDMFVNEILDDDF